MFVYNYLLEEQIMQLKNSQPLIQPVILCAGVLYGRSGFDLKDQMESATNCGDSYMLAQKNSRLFDEDNTLPILHVNRLMEEIETLIYPSSQNDSKSKKVYNVLC